VKAACALSAVLFLVGCGSRTGSSGRASLWITRDRGAHVLLVRSVPAGVTAMEALARAAKVKTRYGGRFVESIDGVAGSLTRQRDWFYFVNGIEADSSAAEYRLHAGDVEWWDYRPWRGQMSVPVVVGAFPEPFLHGYGGRRRPAAVRYSTPRLAAGARAIGRLIRARSVASAQTPVPKDANLFLLVTGPRRFTAQRRGGSVGDPVTFVLAGDPLRLARHPQMVRFRYEGLP
jgi:Domain of unknown function (DUF4430)